jgi:hypothetical protein
MRRLMAVRFAQSNFGQRHRRLLSGRLLSCFSHSRPLTPYSDQNLVFCRIPCPVLFVAGIDELLLPPLTTTSLS